MSFSKEDKKFMQIAVQEAAKSLKRGDYPVGAVLVINGKMIAKINNSLHTKKDWASHAEADLLRKYSSRIRQEITKNKSEVVIYSSLEPCLMCLGTCALHMVSKICYASPDPHGGAMKLDPRTLSDWYVRKWPKIESGYMKEESSKMIVQFLENYQSNSSKQMLELFNNMRNKWK